MGDIKYGANILTFREVRPGGECVSLTRQIPLPVPSNQGNPLPSVVDVFCKSAATKGCFFRPCLPLPELQEKGWDLG